MERNTGSVVCFYMLAMNSYGCAADYESIAKRTRHAEVAVPILVVKQKHHDEPKDEQGCNHICKKGNDAFCEHQEIVKAILSDRVMEPVKEDDDTTVEYADEMISLQELTTSERVHFIKDVGIVFQTKLKKSCKRSEEIKRINEFDKFDQELISLYLSYALMCIGIRQKFQSTECCEHYVSQGKKIQESMVCGNPAVPFPFPYDFNYNCIVDDNGRSFMTYVIALNDTEIVDMLILRGASVNCPDKRGIFPLQEALNREIASGCKGYYKSMIALLKSYGALISHE